MDYQRIYNLCLLGVGVLLLLSYVPELLAGGPNILVIGILIGSVIMIAGALYGLARPEVVNGPTESNFVFWGMVLAFVLVFAATVLQFV